MIWSKPRSPEPVQDNWVAWAHRWMSWGRVKPHRPLTLCWLAPLCPDAWPSNRVRWRDRWDVYSPDNYGNFKQWGPFA